MPQFSPSRCPWPVVSLLWLTLIFIRMYDSNHASLLPTSIAIEEINCFAIFALRQLRWEEEWTNTFEALFCVKNYKAL